MITLFIQKPLALPGSAKYVIFIGQYRKDLETLDSSEEGHWDDGPERFPHTKNMKYPTRHANMENVLSATRMVM